MKKILVIILAMIITVCGCGAKQDEKATNGDNTSSTAGEQKEPVTLDIFQFKMAIVEQLDGLVEDFMKEYPYITVKVDTVGGGEDYATALKSRMNSGNEPTIFNVLGHTELEMWKDRVLDLTNESWVANALPGTLDNITKDGKVYGMPYNIEGYGYMYNKALLEKAGYSEDDLYEVDTWKELEDLFKDLDNRKEELGIEGVLSFSVGATAWWTASMHSLNVPFSSQEEPFEFLNELKTGTASIHTDNQFKAYPEMLDFMFKYSLGELLTVEYDTQITNFAIGKTAFIHQGNWTINMIKEVDDSIELGFIPVMLPGDFETNNSIPTGIPNHWVINSTKSEAEIEAAKLFLDYMVNSARGQKFLVEDCKFIPAFSNVDTTKSNDLAKSILKFTKDGRTIPWVFPSLPDGYTAIDAKEAIQMYYGGELTAEEFLKRLDEKFKEKY